MSTPTTPSMDQLWDRLPDEPEALEPDALRQWANRLSPKARAAIIAALHEGCIECGHVLVVPEENKPYVCGTCITKRSDKNNG